MEKELMAAKAAELKRVACESPFNPLDGHVIPDGNKYVDGDYMVTLTLDKVGRYVGMHVSFSPLVPEKEIREWLRLIYGELPAREFPSILGTCRQWILLTNMTVARAAWGGAVA